MRETKALATVWLDLSPLITVGTVSDEPKLLGILHFAQRDHHVKKVHAIGQHIDDARAAPLAAAKNVPKLIALPE